MFKIFKTRYILMLFGIIITISTVFCFIVDWKRVKRFSIPVFSVERNEISDDGYGKYVGVGYSFDIYFDKEDHLPKDYPVPEVTKYELKILGKTLMFDQAGLYHEIANGIITKIEKESADIYPYIIYVDEGLGTITKMRVYSDTKIYGENDLCVGDKIKSYSEYYPITVSDDVFPALEIHKE